MEEILQINPQLNQETRLVLLGGFRQSSTSPRATLIPSSSSPITPPPQTNQFTIPVCGPLPFFPSVNLPPSTYQFPTMPHTSVTTPHCNLPPYPNVSSHYTTITSPFTHASSSTFQPHYPGYISHQNTSHKPKIDFPRFGGKDPYFWISKCLSYYQVHPTDEYQKVVIASIHLDGHASRWYRNHIIGRAPMIWEEFVREVLERFRPLPHENVVWDFKNCRQVGTVADYQEQFEELKGQMMLHNGSLTKVEAMNYFIGGLREDLRNMVQSGNPSSLQQAFGLARLHESTVDLWAQGKFSIKSATGNHFGGSFRQKSPVISSTCYSQNRLPSANARGISVGASVISPAKSTASLTGVKKLTPKEWQSRREKGLCFNCHEKFTPGHKCSQRQLYFIEEEEECVANDQRGDVTEILEVEGDLS